MRCLAAIGLMLGLAQLSCTAETLDFSAGFEQMSALGLPDLTGAKWVGLSGKASSSAEAALRRKVPSLQGRNGGYGAEENDEEEEDEDGDGSEASPKAKKHDPGRAWLIPGANGRPDQVVLAQWQPARPLAGVDRERVQESLTALSKKYGNARDAKTRQIFLREWDAALDGWTAGEWTPADLAKDVAWVEDAVLSMRRSGDEREDMVQRIVGGAKGGVIGEKAPKPAANRPLPKIGAEDLSGTALPGYFLFAANIWRSGEKALGNRLAGALLDSVSDPQALLDAVMTQLANQQMEALHGRFGKSHDWDAYAKELEALKTRFTRGWNNAVGLDRLIAAAKKRVAGEKPALTLEGFTFSAEDQALVSQLLDRTDAGAIVWKPVDSETHPEGANGGSQDRSTDADTEDDSAAEAGEEDADDEGNGPPQERLWTLNPPPAQPGGLNAIAARGIAGIPLLVALLKSDLLTLSEPQESSDRFSDTFSFSGWDGGDETSPQAAFDALPRFQTLRELAEAALRTVVPMTETRRSYSRSGSDDTKALATAAVAFFRQHQKSTPAELQRHYVKSGTPWQQAIALREMLAEPNPDVAFIEEQFLAAPSSDQQTNLTAYLRSRKAKAADFFKKYTEALKAAQPADGNGRDPVAQLIARLEPLVNAKTLSDRVRELETAGDMEKAWGGLATVLANERIADAVDALLGYAVETKSPLLAVSSLTMSVQARKGKVEPALFTEAGRRAKWERLLDDTRPLPHPMRRYGWSVGSATAMVIEWIAMRDSEDEARRFAFQCRSTDPAKDAFALRARARVAGQPVPNWPFEPPLPADAKKALVADAKTKSAAEMGAWIDSLSAAEWVALTMGLERKFPPAWTEASRVVATVEVPDGPWKDAYAWDTLKGRRLDRATAQSIIAALLEKPLPACSVFVEANLRASALAICVEPMEHALQDGDKAAAGFLTVTSRQPNGWGRNTTHRQRLKDQPPTPPKADGTDGEEGGEEAPEPDDPAKLAEQLAFLDDPPEKGMPGSVNITISVRPVEAAKPKASNGAASDAKESPASTPEPAPKPDAAQ